MSTERNLIKTMDYNLSDFVLCIYLAQNKHGDMTCISSRRCLLYKSSRIVKQVYNINKVTFTITILQQVDSECNARDVY